MKIRLQFANRVMRISFESALSPPIRAFLPPATVNILAMHLSIIRVKDVRSTQIDFCSGRSIDGSVECDMRIKVSRERLTVIDLAAKGRAIDYLPPYADRLEDMLDHWGFTHELKDGGVIE